MKLVILSSVLVVTLSYPARQAGEGHMVMRRQADNQQKEGQTDQFYLFGQVLGSFVTLIGTAAEEGGHFVENQIRAGEPILQTVGNISDTLGGSDFVQSVAGSAGSVARNGPQLVSSQLNLAQDTTQMLSSMSCLFVCPHYTAGEQRRACQQDHCKN
eukprot:GFUD01055516.1.p1 GENE.GFUD01055516.1~~GFUD01055516.1.p1  ORF type:complete len:157 (-),score=45.70 GFUD01055516.1:89-559(-)